MADGRDFANIKRDDEAVIKDPDTKQRSEGEAKALFGQMRRDDPTRGAKSSWSLSRHFGPEDAANAIAGNKWDFSTFGPALIEELRRHQFSSIFLVVAVVCSIVLVILAQFMSA